MLRALKKKPNESLLELLYRVIEISKPVEVDEVSIVQYFTNAIPDEHNNKVLMYQATSIAELKTKIKIYEQISANVNKPKQRLKCIKCPNLNNHTTEQCNKINGPCFKCGKKGHRAYECRSQTNTSQECNIKTEGNRNNRTQNYNNYPTNSNHFNNYQPFQNSNNSYNPRVQNNGNHIQRNQNNNNYENQQPTKNKTNTNVQTNIAKMARRLYKDVKIKYIKCTAMIDTGSDVCLITKSIYELLPNVQLVPQKISISGIGLGEMKTLGYITVDIEVDNIKIAWQLHVANDEDILYQNIIGNDILQLVDINLNSEVAIFLLKKEITNKSTNEICDNSDSKSDINTESSYNENFSAGIEFKTLCTMLSCEFEEELSEKLSHLSKNEKSEVVNLINTYQPFQSKESPIEMKIVVTDDIPVCQRPRRLALCDQKVVEEQISNWLSANIVKTSTSQYASPVVLVAKKDGTKRLCIDYRKLNEKIIKDNFPMILIDDVVAKLQKAKVFTTLDLRNGFFMCQ